MSKWSPLDPKGEQGWKRTPHFIFLQFFPTAHRDNKAYHYIAFQLLKQEGSLIPHIFANLSESCFPAIGNNKKGKKRETYKEMSYWNTNR
jgi:hypothetical protein